MRRSELVREMHQTGCRLDDAAACADVAIMAMREERNKLMLAARNAGLSYRQIEDAFGLSKSQVQRVVAENRSSVAA